MLKLRPLKLRLLLIVMIAALTATTGWAAEPAKTEIQMKRAPELIEIQQPADSSNQDKSVQPAKKKSNAIIKSGTGQLINQRAAGMPAPNLGSAGDATFNFEGESVQTVVKVILGDLLQQNYVIAPGVQGTVTLATPRPVSPAQAISLLEMVLGWNNARLIWSDGRYNVVSSEQAIAGNLAPRTGSPANARGYEIRAVPLKFISATEMEKLLRPYARDKAIVQVDNMRNMIVLGGTRAELQNYLRTVEIFDVDWLAGMSVGIFPLQSAEADKVVTELDKVFGENGKTPLSGMFRFMPLEGQNAVMVITSQPKYLRDVEVWIERMDAGGEGVRLYVYEVKNVKAADLADQLSSVFGNSSSNSRGSDSVSLQPGLEPVEVRTLNDPPPANTPKPGAAADARNSALSIGSGEVSISAVEESNSLLIRASPGQWESIRRAIDRLDSMPLQVHIEAQVIEVKLGGKLEYGVSWFFREAIRPSAAGTPGNGNTQQEYDLSQSTNGISTISSVITGLAGANWTFIGPNAKAIVSALDDLSDVQVLSAPSLVVRNNVEADFNSGQQIPVVSTSVNPGNGNGNNTINQVQFRQTGISLKVKPRISSSGIVFMEITQEVSSPSRGPLVGGNVSVDTNKLQTEAYVQSGETVMLAGLIKTDQGKGSSGIPFLSRLPVIGALFGNQYRTNSRQEILVLITPTIIRDPSDARRLTDEYGERFRALDPLRKEREKASK